MIPANFEYKRANSIDEAIQLLGEDDKILAGGHSLIPAMKLRLNMPDALVDISRIPGISTISDQGDYISIGAAATHAQIQINSLVQTHCPMMSEAAGMIGDLQVRNFGTIGGSIAHADPAADWPALLLAADAKVQVVSSEGSRTIDINDFFQGFFTTALEDNEIITEIHIPKSMTNAHSCYEKFVQPASRYAIAGCASGVHLEDGVVKDIRVAFSGVGEVQYRSEGVENALKGKTLNAENIASASNHAAEGTDVMSDHFASEKYRSHLAKVYAKRSLSRLM